MPKKTLDNLAAMRKTVLILNTGSSSVKFAVARGRKIFLRGLLGHFGRQAEVITTVNGRRRTETMAVPTLRAALSTIRRLLVIHRIRPDAVAHRIVHGGQRSSKPTRLTPTALAYLHGLVELAPLHQPANLAGVSWAKKAWPPAAQWGVFDTAVFRALPERARIYALPARITKRLHIEKYGFHGTSHAWAFRQATKKLGVAQGKLSAVTIHLGAGASMTLWRRGKPMDTTMGFTPLAGLVMSTRAGDIDPAIPVYIQEKLRWSAGRVGHMLEFESGIHGLCGLNDMRDVLSTAGYPVKGWPHRHRPATVRANAKLALEIYIYYIRHNLAGYIGMSEKIKAIVFTGRVGANRDIQRLVIKDLPAARKIPYLTVPADEEQAMISALPL